MDNNVVTICVIDPSFQLSMCFFIDVNLSKIALQNHFGIIFTYKISTNTVFLCIWRFDFD